MTTFPAADSYTLASTCPDTAYFDLREVVLAPLTPHADAVAWASAPAPEWRRLLLTDDGRVIAHIGVKANRQSPDVWLCHLLVHPEGRRHGLATRLVDLAAARFGTRLRAEVAPSSPTHLLLLGLGWAEVDATTTSAAPGTGVVLACVQPHQRPSR